jgi:steroid delta-isomerase-like uncharacterized protein
MATFLDLLADDVAHDINQGKRALGKKEFTRFMEEMNTFYDERVEDLVIFSGDKPGRYAAEFRIEGKYLKSAPSLPPAKGQKYSLPVGAFFEIENNKVKRISNFYNLQDWLAQVK